MVQFPLLRFVVQGFILSLSRGFGWFNEVSFRIAFILSTKLSDIPSAMPRTVALGMVTDSSLKFASITRAQLCSLPVGLRSSCDVITCSGYSNRDRTRA